MREFSFCRLRVLYKLYPISDISNISTKDWRLRFPHKMLLLFNLKLMWFYRLYIVWYTICITDQSTIVNTTSKWKERRKVLNNFMTWGLRQKGKIILISFSTAMLNVYHCFLWYTKKWKVKEIFNMYIYLIEMWVGLQFQCNQSNWKYTSSFQQINVWIWLFFNKSKSKVSFSFKSITVLFFLNHLIMVFCRIRNVNLSSQELKLFQVFQYLLPWHRLLILLNSFIHWSSWLIDLSELNSGEVKRE